jgi:hypothetical protein
MQEEARAGRAFGRRRGERGVRGEELKCHGGQEGEGGWQTR